jgi:hypothetical protein
MSRMDLESVRSSAFPLDPPSSGETTGKRLQLLKSRHAISEVPLAQKRARRFSRFLDSQRVEGGPTPTAPNDDFKPD